MAYLDQFHYKIQGGNSLPKIAFLHGIMGSGNNWLKITSQLSNYQSLTFDQRGHGRSFKPKSGYSPENYAEDLKKIVDELGWEHFSLVGHSMGGRNALSFAQNNAERLTSLVIEDIGPGNSPRGRSKIHSYLDLVPTPFSSRLEAKNFFQNEFMSKMVAHPQARVLSQFFYMNIENLEDGTADWRFYKKGVLETLERGRDYDFWPVVEKLRIPVLWVRGASSTDLEASVYKEILQKNPLIQGEEVLGAGHWVHSEKPRDFVRVLRAFLEATTSL